MARMLGRWQVPGCCPGTRKGLPPGPDCSGGGSMTARYARRMEARWLAAELAPEADSDWLASIDPLIDVSDCRHGCNGWPCSSEQCTFICHEGWPMRTDWDGDWRSGATAAEAAAAPR